MTACPLQRPAANRQPHAPRQDRAHTPPACADLERLARQVARLSPSHRDPERFHVSKSEIAGELRRLARALGKPA